MSGPGRSGSMALAEPGEPVREQRHCHRHRRREEGDAQVARRHEGLRWAYEEPLTDAVAVTGLVAFWDELVDVYVDGERRERPGGAYSEALRDEFGVQAAATTPTTAGPRS
jgi:hypothetical protein